MSNILFIKTSSFGDVIHHMPAVTEARRHRPDAHVAWVVEEAFAPVVRLHPAVDEVIPVASRRWRRALFRSGTWKEVWGFARANRRLRHDDIIDSQGLFRSALIARLARGRRHGYDAASIRERLASSLYDVRHKVDRDLHAIERNRILTGVALGYAPAGDIDFGLDPDALRPAGTGRYAVLLHATARREKQWPEERWIEAGRALQADHLGLIVPFGTEVERDRSRRIASALPQSEVPERRPLDAMARLLAGAALVVGVDTGLVHLAAALRVPLVALFTGSEPRLTGPMGTGPIAIVGRNGRVPSVVDVVAATQRVIAAKRD
ncbi:MAG TPA: lipopolysaccharide heptosyltransferase I [Xanthobacteraceae bacterium]|nr:lipopolysaccharide heptosyltransferase I [Xanthobacteraceae bacterium]